MEGKVDFSKLRIIVGDYNNISLKVTLDVFLELGLKPEVVESGEEILEKIKNGEKFDVIFTNYLYRIGRDAENILIDLRAINGFDSKIVLLTATQDDREYFICKCKFDEYIDKPLTKDKLEHVLKVLFSK